MLILYCSPKIVRVMKSKLMGWKGHVPGMGGKRAAYRILYGITVGK